MALKITTKAKAVINSLIESEEIFELSDENIGVCVSCGHQQDSVEPDAENYECESCGEMQVYGLEQIILYTTI